MLISSKSNLQIGTSHLFVNSFANQQGDSHLEDDCHLSFQELITLLYQIIHPKHLFVKPQQRLRL